jgi:hypothetical protein
MHVQSNVVLRLAILLLISSAAVAHSRALPAEPADSKADVAITLQIAGQPYHYEGKAECRHAPVASIYSVAAQLWTVSHNERELSMTLTLWHPGNTPDGMFVLSVTRGGKSYLVNTVKAGGEGAVRGSGRVVFTKSGFGGTFTIDARAANGAAISGTIKCSAFAAAIAEGGD